MYSEHFKRLWSAYKRARLLHEQFKADTELAYKNLKMIEGELVDAMVDTGADDPVPIEGMKIYLSADRSCSVNQDNMAEVEQWLNEQKGGAETFKRMIIDPWAVKRLVREEIKDGADPSSYPEFLKVAVRPRLNVRGWIGNGDKEGDSDE